MEIFSESIDCMKIDGDYMKIDYFPDEILLEILSKLDFEDLIHCYRVSRRWYILTRSLNLKKIVIKRHLKSYQFSLLIDHHFHKQLEIFEYLNCDFRWSFIHHSVFSKLWRKCPKIKKLVLRQCSLVCVSLNDMPSTLQHLCLRGSKIDPYDLFKNFEEHDCGLTCLDLSAVNSCFTSETLHLLLRLKHLNSLYLEDSIRINNGGIECIVELLPQLRVLDIEGTDISNEGVHIAISYGSGLKELYIGRTCIDNDALSNIPTDRISNLSRLCVRYTQITSSCIKQLNHSLKNPICILSCFDDNERDPLMDFSYKKKCHHYLSHVCIS